MLENIRESSQGLTAKIILGLVILTFALAGIGSYTNSVDTSVAEVNGQKISLDAFNKAYQSQRNRMAQQFGEMFETLSADSTYMANFRNGVLDNLINEKLIDQNITNLAIRVSDNRIKQTIREMKEFQVDGVFDNNRYLAIINQSGFYQSSDFRDYLRVEMTRRQLTQALVATEFNLPYQESMLSVLQNQKRDIRFATIKAEGFQEDVVITDEQINNYYQENLSRFQNQEKVKVNYLALDVTEIAKSIEVSDTDINTYYQENIENYRQAEQRRVSHILIEMGDDETAAKEKAAKVLIRVNAGEDFAALAKEFSTDTFSGEKGGDLDWIERGNMDPAFDESAFSLTEIGSVSDLVKTDFGFHILKVTDIKREKTTPLIDIRDEISEKVSNQKAQNKFFELQQEMARLSFEFPDSLEDAAQAVNATVITSQWLTRSNNTVPFDNNKVIDAVFSDLVLNDQLNSDLIEVNDSLAIVVRLNEYQAANAKPLAQVSDEIKQILIANKATDKAHKVAEELLAEFKAGTDITEKLTAINSNFETKTDIDRFSSDVDINISKEAFSLPHPIEGVVSADIVTLNDGNLAILEVQTVKEGKIIASPNLAKQQTNQLAQSAYQSYVESLKVDAKIVRHEVSAPTTQY